MLSVSVISSLAQSGTNLTITTQPQSQTVPAGGNATFSVAVSGTGPFSYQWQFDGTNLGSIGIITTFAGNGNATYSGDGAPATSASLNEPAGVAVDAFGNLFIADYYNNRIRKVDANGIITTVAGNGPIGVLTGSYSGDGGAATNAGLNNPYGVAVDTLGNLFIVDSYNYRIRKVDANGIISTIAGNGTNGYSGDGGPATNASLSLPDGAAVDDSGNLFIADNLSNRIRKVDANGIISTIAGNGTNGYSGDGGAATNARLANPENVMVDAVGNVFIGDNYNNRVRKVDTNGVITTVAGNGTNGYSGDGGAATNASLSFPSGMALDAFGNLFIADTSNNHARRVSAGGIITTVAGDGTCGYSGDGGMATNASMCHPIGVAVDSSGNLLIAQQYGNRIRKVMLSSGPTFSINNVTTNNAGNYSVIVSNSSQSVTSSVAVLQINSIIEVNGKLAAGSVASIGPAQVSFLGQFPNGFLFYTLDGSTPTTGSTLYFGPFTLTNGATVQVLNVNSNDTQSILSPPVYVQVVAAPTISAISPTNVVLAAGSALDLAVTASGTAPLAYQWWGGSGAITGATNANYYVGSVGTNDAGGYFAVVSNPYASATSAVATMTVYGPVMITAQPSNQVTRAGGTATFSVAATGYPAPTYQWTFGTTNLPGATSNALTISNVQLTNLGSYAVLVSNAYSSQLSDSATLSMSPSIITPFAGATAIWGRSVDLSVGAIGSGPLIYQWFLNGNAIAAATNSDFDLSSVQFTNGGLYTVVVSSSLGSVTNTPALLVVNPAGTSIGMYAGITITGTAGYNYTIQYTGDLRSTNSWITLTNLTLDQPVEIWVDTSTNALTTAHRYYQVLPGQ
jgi:sugar lactone lactonase YvrE